MLTCSLDVGWALALKAPRFAVTNRFNLRAVFAINHDLQLARCLVVGSALAEKSTEVLGYRSL